MENIVSEKIDRRKFLAGAGAAPWVLVSLGGCGSSQVRQPGTPHYGMVFDQNKCVGCRDCRIACNETNKLPKGVTRLLLELQDDQNRRQARLCRRPPLRARVLPAVL